MGANQASSKMGWVCGGVDTRSTQAVLPTDREKCYNISVNPGWCNGNTDASGALIQGSSPCPGKI